MQMLPVLQRVLVQSTDVSILSLSEALVISLDEVHG